MKPNQKKRNLDIRLDAKKSQKDFVYQRRDSPLSIIIFLALVIGLVFALYLSSGSDATNIITGAPTLTLPVANCTEQCTLICVNETINKEIREVCTSECSTVCDQTIENKTEEPITPPIEEIIINETIPEPIQEISEEPINDSIPSEENISETPPPTRSVEAEDLTSLEEGIEFRIMARNEFSGKNFHLTKLADKVSFTSEGTGFEIELHDREGKIADYDLLILDDSEEPSLGIASVEKPKKIRFGFELKRGKTSGITGGFIGAGKDFSLIETLVNFLNELFGISSKENTDEVKRPRSLIGKALLSKGGDIAPENNNIYKCFENKENKKGSQNQIMSLPGQVASEPLSDARDEQIFKSFGDLHEGTESTVLEQNDWKTAGCQNQVMSLSDKQVAFGPSGFKTLAPSELRVPALPSNNSFSTTAAVLALPNDITEQSDGLLTSFGKAIENLLNSLMEFFGTNSITAAPVLTLPVEESNKTLKNLKMKNKTKQRIK